MPKNNWCFKPPRTNALYLLVPTKTILAAVNYHKHVKDLLLKKAYVSKSRPKIKHNLFPLIEQNKSFIGNLIQELSADTYLSWLNMASWLRLNVHSPAEIFNLGSIKDPYFRGGLRSVGLLPDPRLKIYYWWSTRQVIYLSKPLWV